MKRHNLLSTSIKCALITAAATASNSVLAQDEQATKIERVEVTGSRILREGAIAPAPVTVISGEQLINTGAVNIGEALNNLPCIYTVTCFSDVSYNLIELKHWRSLLLEKPELSLYTAQTIAAKFQENQKINLDKLLLPLSYNIAKDCLLRAENNNPTLLRAYPTVNAEAERFATTERAYRRVVTELVEKGLIVRSNQGLKVVDIEKLSNYVDSFSQL